MSTPDFWRRASSLPIYHSFDTFCPSLPLPPSSGDNSYHCSYRRQPLRSSFNFTFPLLHTFTSTFSFLLEYIGGQSQRLIVPKILDTCTSGLFQGEIRGGGIRKGGGILKGGIREIGVRVGTGSGGMFAQICDQGSVLGFISPHFLRV